MLTSDFDFHLPKDLIAQSPALPRDSARLLQVGQGLGDHRVSDLPGLLRPGDLLVTNNTKVIPARLNGTRIAPPNAQGRGAAQVEVTLLKNSAGTQWQAFARPGKRLQIGDRVVFSAGLEATVADKTSDGQVTLAFTTEGTVFFDQLDQAGFMPLPPYIQRQSGGDSTDKQDYQTIFAAEPGAVAAPTAGLHFTETLLGALAQKGIGRCQLTLHVGAGTFLPVKADRAEDHEMHAEYGILSDETAKTIRHTQARGGRIVAVGTTALRLLESACDESGHLQPFQGETDIFILPGYKFRCVDLLLTNFHLPRSTLFMLVSAFAGLERMKAAYVHAIDSHYRFYSYGDACLLERVVTP